MPEYIHDRAATDREKEEVMRRLELVWKKFPSLRLGQLLVCAVNQNDIFYPEDFEVVRKAEAFAERHDWSVRNQGG